MAHLASLPPFEELFIDFSMPIPRLSTERELLREQGTPVTLPGPARQTSSSKALELIWKPLSLKL